jgi:hypothetical protein
VDANEPEFSFLAAGPPAMSTAVREHLEPFTATGFRDRLARLIERSEIRSISSDVTR